MRFLTVTLALFALSAANGFVLRAIPIVDDGIQDFVVARSHHGDGFGSFGGDGANVISVIGSGGGGGGHYYPRQPFVSRPITVHVDVPYHHHRHRPRPHYHHYNHDRPSHYPVPLHPFYNGYDNDDDDKNVNVENTNVNNITVTTNVINNASARSLLFYKPNYELINLEDFEDYYSPRQLYTLTPIVKRIPVPVPVPVPVLVEQQEIVPAQEELVPPQVKKEVIEETEPIAPVETKPIAPVKTEPNDNVETKPPQEPLEALQGVRVPQGLLIF